MILEMFSELNDSMILPASLGNIAHLGKFRIHSWWKSSQIKKEYIFLYCLTTLYIKNLAKGRSSEIWKGGISSLVWFLLLCLGVQYWCFVISPLLSWGNLCSDCCCVKVLVFTSARRKKSKKNSASHMLMNFSAHFDTNSNISPAHDIKVIVNGIL